MKKVVPKLRQEVKVKVAIVTSDDIKIYYTGKFQDFTARYIIKSNETCKDIYVLGLFREADSIGPTGTVQSDLGSMVLAKAP